MRTYCKAIDQAVVFPMLDSASPASFKSGLTVAATAYVPDGAGSWTSLALSGSVAEIGATGLYVLPLTDAERQADAMIVKCTAAGAADTMLDLVSVESLLSAMTTEAKMPVGSVGEALQGARAHALGTRRGKLPGNDHVEVLYSFDQTTEIGRRRLLPETGNYDRAVEYGTRNVRIDAAGSVAIAGAETNHGEHELLDGSGAITFTGADSDHHTGITLDSGGSMTVAGSATTHA